MNRSLGSVLLASLLLAVFANIATADPLTVGQAAPPLTLTSLTNAPDGTKADWVSLRGKVVVLEFWATWCEGCIQQIPHLNALVKELAKEPVQFIAVDDEEPAVAEKLLKRFPIDGWVAYTTKKTIESYDAQVRPKTVVVGPDGNIKAILSPGLLTADPLKALAHGQPANFPVDTMAAIREDMLKSKSDTAESANDAPLLDISVRPGKPGGTMMTKFSRPKGQNNFVVDSMNSTLAILLDDVGGISSTRLSIQDGPKTTYSVHIVVPYSEFDLLKPAIAQSVAVAAGMDLRRTTAEEEVWVLQATPKATALLKPPASNHGGMCYVDPRTGKLMFMMCTMKDIAGTLEENLKTPVIDETGIAGEFDAVVDYPKGGVEAVRAMLEEQFGLTLVRAQRPVERVYLEPLAKDGVAVPQSK